MLEGRLSGRPAPDPDDGLRRVVDCIAEPAIVLAGGRVVYANTAAVKSHGANHRDDLIGQAQIALIHPDDRKILEGRLVDAARRRDTIVFAALRGLTVSGEIFRETLKIATVSWRSQDATLVICRKYASTDARALTPPDDDITPPVLEGVNSGVWEWNPATGAVYLGPRLKQMLDGGVRNHGSIFGGWPEIVDRSDLEKVRDSLEAHIAGETKIFDVETRLGLGGGEYRWVRLIGKALRDGAGNVTKVSGTASDISRLKSAETDLRTRTSELTQIKALLDSRTAHMAGLETQLRAAKHEAQLAQHDKIGFLATMSHELRTPLNAIMGFAEVIRDEMLGPSGVPRYRDYADDILSGATHLLGVIDDILDLSNLEAGNVELQEEVIDLPRLAASVLRMVRGRADAADLSLDIDVPRDIPALKADRRMVKQMTLHLLSNAINFTPAGGTVELGAFVEADRGIRIAVCDTGAEIDEENSNGADLPSGQVGDPIVRGRHGNGLGIPIVRAQVELHGGSIELESVPPIGTMATLCFPPARTIEK